MNILHIAPHLGGGVGKAHAAVAAVLPKEIKQTFVLLEPPKDRRTVEAIEAHGARIVVGDGVDRAADLARAADIVQFEFWNHPRLFECLARARFPAMRSVFWSHISGLAPPLIPPGLMQQAGRFVFSSEASLAIPALSGLGAAGRQGLGVIGSGFGFARAEGRRSFDSRVPAVAYLGTVDFVKMHPGFFDAIDALADGAVAVSVWGDVDPSGEVAARARAMRHPGRVEFRGRTDAPDAALSAADIFFYPLQRDHYGTGENALVEAMSLGLVPVVLDNPAELAIVRHGETGLAARSIAECAVHLNALLSSPDLRRRLSANAMRDVAENRTAARSAARFMELWQGLHREPARMHDFRAALGDTPADWFLATQSDAGNVADGSARFVAGKPSKGTLGHFMQVFPADRSWSRLVDVAAGLP